MVKLEEEVKELKNLVEEIKADIIEKDNDLDHPQKRSDELYTLLREAKEVAFKEFKASSEYTDLLDKKYVVGFEDFHMDALELFPEIDFSLIKLRVAAESSLLQTSFEDINVEDDASTQFANDDLKFGGDSPVVYPLEMISIPCFFSLFIFLFFLFYLFIIFRKGLLF